MRSLLRILVACGACAFGVLLASWFTNPLKAVPSKVLNNTCDFAYCTGISAGWYYDAQNDYIPVDGCILEQEDIAFLNCKPDSRYDCGFDPVAQQQLCQGETTIGTEEQPIFVDCWTAFRVCNTAYPH